MIKKNTVIAIVVVAVIVLLGFFFFPGNSNTSSDGLGSNSQPGAEELSVSGTWRNLELKDVNSGKIFKISDLSDKPILMESFAVWCPTCTRQQREINEL
ncbi:MAG: peroxiredoxin family protein, partial [Candidatus Nanoarchaeia archaeon]